MLRRMPQRTDLFDLGRLGLTSGEGRRWTCTSMSTRSNTAARRTPSIRSWCPCAWTSPAPPATAGRCGCASTRRIEGPCMRCLDPANPTYAVDSYEVHQPGAGDADLLSPYMGEELDLEAWARDALALALPAQLTCRPDCAGLCPQCGANLNEDPDARARAGARRALVEAVRAEVRLDGSLSFLAAMAVPKQKQSHARTSQRRAQHKITAPTTNGCPQCRQPRRPHRVCPHLRVLRRSRGRARARPRSRSRALASAPPRHRRA